MTHTFYELYQLFPKLDCGLCGNPSCRTTARKVATGEATVDQCANLGRPEFKQNRKGILNILKEGVEIGAKGTIVIDETGVTYIHPCISEAARAQRLLFELIKNSKNSDRNIAKILGVSQPTVTRMRKKLEEKTIVEYTVTPNLTELGYELMAVTFVSIRGSVKLEEERRETLEKWMMEQPNIVFACDGTGMGMNGMIISIHKNYTDFSQLMTKLRMEWSETLGEIKIFVSSIRGGIILKPYSLKYLEKVT